MNKNRELVGYEPSAAETVSEGTCSCHDCNNSAIYRVEIECEFTTLICENCSRDHRIWVRANGLLQHQVTVDGGSKS